MIQKKNLKKVRELYFTQSVHKHFLLNEFLHFFHGWKSYLNVIHVHTLTKFKHVHIN